MHGCYPTDLLHLYQNPNVSKVKNHTFWNKFQKKKENAKPNILHFSSSIECVLIHNKFLQQVHLSRSMLASQHYFCFHQEHHSSNLQTPFTQKRQVFQSRRSNKAFETSVFFYYSPTILHFSWGNKNELALFQSWLFPCLWEELLESFLFCKYQSLKNISLDNLLTKHCPCVPDQVDFFFCNLHFGLINWQKSKFSKKEKIYPSIRQKSDKWKRKRLKFFWGLIKKRKKKRREAQTKTTFFLMIQVAFVRKIIVVWIEAWTWRHRGKRLTNISDERRSSERDLLWSRFRDVAEE